MDWCSKEECAQREKRVVIELGFSVHAGEASNAHGCSWVNTVPRRRHSSQIVCFRMFGWVFPCHPPHPIRSILFLFPQSLRIPKTVSPLPFPQLWIEGTRGKIHSLLPLFKCITMDLNLTKEKLATLGLGSWNKIRSSYSGRAMESYKLIGNSN